jgi:hypothetical protein
MTHTMNASQQRELVELWSRVHGMAPALRGAALLSNSGSDLTSPEILRLSIGERDRRLLAMRSELFRDRIAAVADCPQCSTALDLEFRLSDFALEPSRTREHEPLRIAKEEYDVTFRLPASEDVAYVSRARNVEQGRRMLLSRCVLSATWGGSDVPVAQLPEEVVAAIAQRMSEADPAGDINLRLDCPACKHGWNAPFDIAAFLWTELDAVVRRGLAEVAELASAFGWAEADILAMPSARKDFYLSMVRG